MMMTHSWATLALAFALACVTMAAGCGTTATPIDPKLAGQLSQQRYPTDAQIKDLDVVVVRNGPIVTLTNRTARPYHDAYLWLNQQYVSWVQHLPIGTDIRLELGHFFNEHGEPFPVGGPLTPDRTLPIVLAELHHDLSDGQAGAESPPNSRPSKRYRLLVRPRRK